jgi:hypothetical protein
MSSRLAARLVPPWSRRQDPLPDIQGQGHDHARTPRRLHHVPRRLHLGGGLTGMVGAGRTRVPRLARRATRGHVPDGSEHLPTDVGLRRRRDPSGNGRVHRRRGGLRRRTHASVEGGVLRVSRGAAHVGQHHARARRGGRSRPGDAAAPDVSCAINRSQARTDDPLAGIKPRPYTAPTAPDGRTMSHTDLDQRPSSFLEAQDKRRPCCPCPSEYRNEKGPNR